MDLTEFEATSVDLLAAIGSTGGTLVGVAVATMTFGFIIAWTRKLYRAAKGS
jgi:hypothetical protein